LLRFALGLDGDYTDGPSFRGGIDGSAGSLPCGKRTGII
jgi:hypothetical protein